jgi:type IV pilus assembly protein PilN
MARINLLPWREAERKHRQRDLAAITAASVAATVLIGVTVHLQLDHLISLQQERNRFLEQQISMVDRKIGEIRKLEQTKANLLARMDVIQRLQQSRPEIVHLFDELVKTIPDGVYLTKESQHGKTIVVEGRAQSNARVSAFMRNIDASTWLGNAHLLLIQQKDKTASGLSEFRLRFNQKEPSSTAPGTHARKGSRAAAANTRADLQLCKSAWQWGPAQPEGPGAIPKRNRDAHRSQHQCALPIIRRQGRYQRWTSTS